MTAAGGGAEAAAGGGAGDAASGGAGAAAAGHMVTMTLLSVSIRVEKEMSVAM